MMRKKKFFFAVAANIAIYHFCQFRVKGNQTCAVYSNAYLKRQNLENLIFLPTQQTDNLAHIKISIGRAFDLLQRETAPLAAASFFSPLPSCLIGIRSTVDDTLIRV